MLKPCSLALTLVFSAAAWAQDPLHVEIPGANVFFYHLSNEGLLAAAPEQRSRQMPVQIGSAMLLR